MRIFGHNFFINNKEKLSFLYENKTYEINEFFALSNISEEKDILEIKLKGIKNVSNLSYMFKDCSLLISFKDNFNMDNIDITDMSYMFSYCSLFKELDAHWNWNTKNVADMSYMFYKCSSLTTLPHISKWIIDNVTIWVICLIIAHH